MAKGLLREATIAPSLSGIVQVEKPVRPFLVTMALIYDLDFDATSFSLLARPQALTKTVKLWSVAGERLDTLGQPQGEVLSVRFFTERQSPLLPRAWIARFGNGR